MRWWKDRDTAVRRVYGPLRRSAGGCGTSCLFHVAQQFARSPRRPQTDFGYLAASLFEMLVFLGVELHGFRQNVKNGHLVVVVKACFISPGRRPFCSSATHQSAAVPLGFGTHNTIHAMLGVPQRPRGVASFSCRSWKKCLLLWIVGGMLGRSFLRGAREHLPECV
jgi:hypothetical protein